MPKVTPAAMVLPLLAIAVLFAGAGAAVYAGRPDLAAGFVWGGFLGEINLYLLRRRLLASRGTAGRSLSVRLGVAFFLRYLIIIIGVWLGRRVAGADIPATLAGFLLAYSLAVARTALRSDHGPPGDRFSP